MASFHFDLVSPERIAFSGEVDQVDVPGASGDFGVLANHALMVTTLRPGILTVHAGGQKQQFAVLGGTAEISASGLTVLADVASTVADLDHAALATRISDAEKKIAGMDAGALLDREIARLDHFKTLQMNLQATALH